MKATKGLLRAAEDLRDGVDGLRFAEPVTYVYNPLNYAWPVHRAYIERFGWDRKRVIFLGMNPGPFGMAQTGVPFGEVAAVRDWMGIDAAVGKPPVEHPKRLVLGLGCAKSEVSGRRLWGLMAERFGTAEAFFTDHFVVNYCPLVFMEHTGRNRTPDKLPPAEKAAFGAACDRHLAAVVAALQPEWCVGVGAYATNCLERVVADGARIGTVLHPSPASPAANRGWAEAATRQLVKMGVWEGR